MEGNTVEGIDVHDEEGSEGRLLLSEDEGRISEVLRSTFPEWPKSSSMFFSPPQQYVNLEQVASGMPTAPWAVYKKADEGGFLEVRYDPLLQCVTTRDVISYPTGGAHPEQARVFWIEEPKVHVAMETHSMYDRSVNRSRIFRKQYWTYIVPAVLAFVHFLWMVVEVSSRGRIGVVAWWVVHSDILTGFITRASAALVAKYWNRGSWLQIALAIVSPMFWSMSFAGSKAVDVGWIWSFPLLTRVFSGLVCTTVNTYDATNNHKFLDVILVVVAFFGMSFDPRILGHFFRRSKVVYEIDFMFLAVYCHLYTMMTHLKLLGHGELPAILVALATLATTEALCLLRAAYALEEVMEASSFVVRMNKCTRSALLAGCGMLCDLRKGLDETLGESECIRTYVTWVVRGTVPGIWKTANIMLPLPRRGTCSIEAKDVASCAAANDDDQTPSQVCCVLAFHGDVSSGDTCIGLQPELRTAFLEEAESFGLSLPRTFYEKGGTGYIRAVGAGIVGLPIL